MASNEKSFKMAVRFQKELDNMRNADFYIRLENKPPKIKKNTTRLTGSSLKRPADLYVDFGTIS